MKAPLSAVSTLAACDVNLLPASQPSILTSGIILSAQGGLCPSTGQSSQANMDASLQICNLCLYQFSLVNRTGSGGDLLTSPDLVAPQS